MGTLLVCTGLALVAGAGVAMLCLRFRPAPPVDVSVDVAALAGAIAAAMTAPRRTVHHGYDTIDVLADGYRAGAHARRDPVTVDPYADGRLSGLAPADIDGDEESWYSVAPPRTPQ